MKIKFLNIFCSYGGKEFFAKRILYIYFRIYFKEQKKYFKISLNENEYCMYQIVKRIYLNKDIKKEYTTFKVINMKSVVGVILYD